MSEKHRNDDSGAQQMRDDSEFSKLNNTNQNSPYVRSSKRTGASKNTNMKSNTHQPSEDKGKKLNKGPRIAIFAGVFVVLVLILVVGVDYALSYNKIHPGVTVQGIAVGGMTRTDAEKTLNKDIAKKLSKSVSVTHEESKWEAVAGNIGASFEATKTVEQAYNVGKKNNIIVDRFMAAFGKIDIPAKVAYRDLEFNAFTNVLSEKTTIDPVQSSVQIKDASTEVVPGKDGTKIDIDKFQSRLTASFMSSKDRNISLPIVTDPMKITPSIAQEAADVAKQMMGSPVSVEYDNKSWNFEPKEISNWISFEETHSADTWALNPFVNKDELSKDTKSKMGELGIVAKNAEFSVSGGTVSIIPSVNGTGVDVVKLATDLTAALKLDEPAKRKVVAKIDTVEPSITTAKAEAMGIKSKISSYTTSYTTGALDRNTNIHQMASFLNNSLVPPGGTWAFHETGGPTTVERGFKPAGAIVDGKIVDELGGGICQVATTVFNAVYESGFPVTERSPHSLYISHYPDGRDAAVSWKQPDLKWKNDSSNWVLLTTSFTNSTLTVTLWGTDPGYTVTSSQSGWSNFTSKPDKEIPDPSLEEGKRVTESKGQEGKTITVTRSVSKDGNVVRTDTFKSTYKPSASIIKVGTKKAEPAPVPVVTP